MSRIVIALVIVVAVFVIVRWRSHDANDDAHATTTVDRSTASAAHDTQTARHHEHAPTLDAERAGSNGFDDIFVGTIPVNPHGIRVRGGDATQVASAWTWSRRRGARARLATTALGPSDRSIRGLVVANGRPVPNASVYAGPAIIGTGTAISGPRVATTTTGADGGFSLAGLTDGDVVIVAEQPSIGRSQPMRARPCDGDVVVPLAAFGSLSGTVWTNSTPTPGVSVACQSTTSPNALYTTVSDRDGKFQFSRLATDTYKVSATIGTQRTGLRLFSKQVDVTASPEATVELHVELGVSSVELAAVPRAGTLGAAGAWIAAGEIVASTATMLAQQLARSSGMSQSVMIRDGLPAHFTLVPGTYTACVVPLPSDVHGFGSVAYLQSHGDALPAFCQPLEVSAALAQSAAIAVDIPPPTTKDQR